MTCEVCGTDCQGRKCRDCAREDALERSHGVPGDHLGESYYDAKYSSGGGSG